MSASPSPLIPTKAAELSALLGIPLNLPILQAPMAGSQGSELAIAVSDAGGLGALPCAMLSVEQVVDELSLIREKNGRAVNVNFFCHQPPEISDTATERWLDTLQPYFDELAIDRTKVPATASRQPFSQAYLDAIAPFKPEVVSFHFGLPAPELLAPIKAWGGKVLSSATTLAEAEWLAAQGVDLIIAQGLEAGGHRGHFLQQGLADQLPVRELVVEITRKIAVPVIAAGGIATPEDVEALLSAGAVGVQVGTALLLTPESKATPLHRKALKSPLNQETVITNLFSGRPARGMINRLIDEQGPMSEASPAFPLAGNAITLLRGEAEKQGSWDFSPLWAGTQAHLCREVSAEQLLYWLSGLECSS